MLFCLFTSYIIYCFDCVPVFNCELKIVIFDYDYSLRCLAFSNARQVFDKMFESAFNHDLEKLTCAEM